MNLPEIHEFQLTLEEYQEINFTPVFDVYIPSLREHTRFKQPLMQVIFSFEDQWMKESHKISEMIFDELNDILNQPDYESMKIRRISEKAQNRVKVTNFETQNSLS